ncbi:MAG: hypothetical protein A3C93_04275 [Candidatus Lloydbacteria bacterium RIFCSPHIGHO2_02_FULL_54_17]|uniref:Uncharacterized protein n=1 Tax=Candidatus Lloydbacteria bacterium RIFCSPHIGHO2_02_FULL_54_17 TaxID=1798664 RepID=A0A1G2DBW8_9BACT|nr:MAG: hypothetical protein A2762_03065 [Candidatus Lloydbacteria bacterium RIFCSPHIGHO2_01_FULL_54_11]OGZ11104.1 MAG: hypothetical protein A3C93_04275 [Candidatus Lloydbacteria bacterium RIFCSPHIGHO2_02_FULL_54_17]OGZ13024.1 MAG: hypothetical protein A2948_06150 [Candidatus Lloydbacteria bacterium RIFCSPLOWO2_01_FULL_54_18]
MPQRVREVLSAEETIDILENIGVKYGLSELDRGFLMRITGKLLNGALPPTEFVKKIVEDIDISRDQAISIAQEINRDIFNEIKDQLLNEVHAKGAPAGTVPASPNTPTKSNFPPQMSTVGPTHVGSIFEQKLGGAFRVKSEAIRYEGTATPPPVAPGTPQFSIPKKPTEVKIPPAQASPPPRS